MSLNVHACLIRASYFYANDPQQILKCLVKHANHHYLQVEYILSNKSLQPGSVTDKLELSTNEHMKWPHSELAILLNLSPASGSLLLSGVDSILVLHSNSSASASSQAILVPPFNYGCLYSTTRGCLRAPLLHLTGTDDATRETVLLTESVAAACCCAIGSVFGRVIDSGIGRRIAGGDAKDGVSGGSSVTLCFIGSGGVVGDGIDEIDGNGSGCGVVDDGIEEVDRV